MPLAMAIPRQATAPALILIGIAMLGTIRTAARSSSETDGITDMFAPMAMMLLTLISNSFGTGIAGGCSSMSSSSSSPGAGARSRPDCSS
jgi:AGZA family xanthine/uracil permease-like MFS transporter